MNVKSLILLAIMAIFAFGFLGSSFALAAEPTSTPTPTPNTFLTFEEPGWLVDNGIATYDSEANNLPETEFGCLNLPEENLMWREISRTLIGNDEVVVTKKVKNTHSSCRMDGFVAAYDMPENGMPMRGISLQYLNWNREVPPAINFTLEPGEEREINYSAPVCRSQEDGGEGDFIQKLMYPGIEGVDYYGYRLSWSRIDTNLPFCPPGA